MNHLVLDKSRMLPVRGPGGFYAATLVNIMALTVFAETICGALAPVTSTAPINKSAWITKAKG